jgi:hypothetical protein
MIIPASVLQLILAFRHYCLYFAGFQIALCGMAFAEVREFDLGGVRQVKARVQHDEGGYHFDIGFRAVSCFDPATNKKINLSKSRGYAIRAMAMSAGITTGTVKAVNLRVSKPLAVNKDRATIQYLADNIEILKDTEVSNKTGPLQPIQGTDQEVTTDRISADETSARTLLSCLGDLRSTLHELERSLDTEIADLESGDTLEDSVADLEERAVAAFGRLEAETSVEKLLLSIEKNGFIAEIRKEQREFMTRLAAKYAALSVTKSSIQNED